MGYFYELFDQIQLFHFNAFIHLKLIVEKSLILRSSNAFCTMQNVIYVILHFREVTMRLWENWNINKKWKATTILSGEKIRNLNSPPVKITKNLSKTYNNNYQFIYVFCMLLVRWWMFSCKFHLFISWYAVWNHEYAVKLLKRSQVWIICENEICLFYYYCK